MSSLKPTAKEAMTREEALAKVEKALVLLLAGEGEEAAAKTFWWGVIKPLTITVVEEAPFPIAAVREGEMVWVRAALEAMPLQEVVGVLVHEAHHLIRWAFDHETVGAESWERAVGVMGEEAALRLLNIAQDMHINADLRQDGFVLPQGVIEEPPPGRFEEETFAILLKQIEEGGRAQCKGMTIDFIPGRASKAGVRDWVVDAARRAGNVPGKYAERVLPREVPYDWREALRQYLLRAAAARGERTWARPNRRMAGLGYMLPEYTYAPSLGKLVISIDTSASMPRSYLEEAVGVVRGVVEAVPAESVKVVYADAEVQRVASIEEDLERIVGRGGTLLGPVLEWCEREGCDLLIHISDMELGDNPAPPNFPVVFVAPEGATHPWGSILHILK